MTIAAHAAGALQKLITHCLSNERLLSQPIRQQASGTASDTSQPVQQADNEHVQHSRDQLADSPHGAPDQAFQLDTPVQTQQESAQQQVCTLPPEYSLGPQLVLPQTLQSQASAVNPQPQLVLEVMSLADRPSSRRQCSVQLMLGQGSLDRESMALVRGDADEGLCQVADGATAQCVNDERVSAATPPSAGANVAVQTDTGADEPSGEKTPTSLIACATQCQSLYVHIVHLAACYKQGALCHAIAAIIAEVCAVNACI